MNIPTAPPSGFRDFLPQACAQRTQAIEIISKVYRSFGFEAIDTSAVEDLAVLTGKGGGENEKLIFKILKRGEKLEEAKAGGELADMGLRFDLTLPLARFYSKYQSQLPHPFKAFHIGPVWRAERAQKGRFREFYQCDVDIVGSESELCEIEVIAAILAAFKAIGLSDVSVHLNDRALIHAALEQAQVPTQLQTQACVIIDKLDKMPREKVLSELQELVGKNSTAELEKTLLNEAADQGLYEKIGPEFYGRLQRIAKAASLSGSNSKIQITPSLMRGLDYYTGPVFEFRHPKFSGSLGGGGRYDHLTEKFGGASVPACGGSIGFERLLLVLAESEAATETPGPDYCVTVFSVELLGKSLTLASTLRQAGCSVDIYPGKLKSKPDLGAQFKYADLKHAKFALILGPDEAAQGQIKVKDMKTGDERLIQQSELLKKP